MPEVTPEEMAKLIHKWQTERPEHAVWPRIPSNPYGDNTVGMTFDEGWWACLKWMREIYIPWRQEREGSGG